MARNPLKAFFYALYDRVSNDEQLTTSSFAFGYEINGVKKPLTIEVSDVFDQEIATLRKKGNRDVFESTLRKTSGLSPHIPRGKAEHPASPPQASRTRILKSVDDGQSEFFPSTNRHPLPNSSISIRKSRSGPRKLFSRENTSNPSSALLHHSPLGLKPLFLNSIRVFYNKNLPLRAARRIRRFLPFDRLPVDCKLFC